MMPIAKQPTSTTPDQADPGTESMLSDSSYRYVTSLQTGSLCTVLNVKIIALKFEQFWRYLIDFDVTVLAFILVMWPLLAGIYLWRRYVHSGT